MAKQYASVNSGPGTFANYLRQASQHREICVTFFTEDVDAPAANERKIELPPLTHVKGGHFIRLYKYHRAFMEAPDRANFDLLWYNTALNGFFSSVLPTPVPVVLMINDYSNAISRWPFSTRKALGAWRSLSRSFWRPLEKLAARRCDAVVVNSQFMKRKIGRLYGVPEAKMHVLYKAVDTSTFTFTPPQVLADPVRILFLKDDFRRGGLRDLLEALAGVPFATSLSVAGPAEQARPTIEHMTRQAGYGGPVQFLGRVPRSRVPELFRAHDVLCVPSYAEALGVVFLEALASGVPAIGSNVGGIPEVLDHGRAGWLPEPGNAQSIRRALEDVAGCPERRLQKATHGLEHAKRFSAHAAVARLNEIACKILGWTAEETA